MEHNEGPSTTGASLWPRTGPPSKIDRGKGNTRDDLQGCRGIRKMSWSPVNVMMRRKGEIRSEQIE